MKNYFSQNLKYLREKRNWSQSELARQTEKICEIQNQSLPIEEHLKPITQASIARWEAGENSPSIDNLVILEMALNVELPELIGKNLKEDDTKKIDLSKKEEIKLLTKILTDKGFLENNEELTEENFNKLVEFAKVNKKFIIKNQKE